MNQGVAGKPEPHRIKMRLTFTVAARGFKFVASLIVVNAIPIMVAGGAHVERQTAAA